MSSVGSFPLFRNPSSGSIEGEEERRGIEAKKKRESENEAAEFQLVSLD